MKKQSKILLGVLSVLVVGTVALVSTNSSLFQGKLISSNTINKAEFAKLLVDNAGFETSPCSVFPDVPEDAWFNGYVCALYDKGILQPYADGTLKPLESLNRAQASKMIHLAFEVDYDCPLPKLFKDIESDAWYYADINELAAYNFFSQEMSIGSNFRPADVLTLSSAKRWFTQSANL